VQAAALSEATKAINMRNAQPSHCVTTFDRNRLPTNERGLLIFTAPPILHELPEQMQSWNNALRGRGRLVVFTDDPETRRVCREHDIPVVCVQHVDEKLPRADKMFDKMHNLQTSGITGYVNSDIALEKPDLFLDFMKFIGDRDFSLERRGVPAQIYREFVSTGVKTEDWFAVAVRTDVSLKGERSLHNVGGYDFWCWNRRPGGPPLLPVSIPPFRFPYGTYDNWVLDMMIQSGQRAVIDATAAVGIVHHEHKRVGGAETWYDALNNGVTGVFINRYLGYNEPRNSTIMHYWRFGTPPECPYVVIVHDPEGSEPGFGVAQRRYWSDKPEERLVREGCYAFAENDPEHLRPTFMGCKLLNKVEEGTRYLQRTLSVLPLIGLPSTPILGSLSRAVRAAAARWRYNLAMMLKNHATADRFVLLTAVNYDYRGHLSNFICNLQRTGMRDHYLVAALDADMYEWGVLNGLPVYMPDVVMKLIRENTKGHGAADEAKPEGYGSSVFKAATKLKSRAVLEILHAGYSVVFSDVDITWFVNPFDALSFFMKSGNSIAIQSNAPYVQTTSTGSDSARPHATVGVVKTDIPAGVRRLNSGLYVAPCTPLVVAAFEEIVAHAAKTTLSEQPTFYDVMCAGERTVDSCTYKPGHLVEPTTQKALVKAGLASAGLKVYLLDRFQYPNGAVLVGKDNENVYVLGKEKFEAATGKELYAAHNNWILGKERKIQRQKYRGWWFLEAGDEQSCNFRQAAPSPLLTPPPAPLPSQLPELSSLHEHTTPASLPSHTTPRTPW